LFQSLFYWISLCDLSFILVFLLIILSFNPCFIGLASVTLTLHRITSPTVGFQSLFYWISLCDFCICNVVRKHSRFQSLFYWISLCDFNACMRALSSCICFNPCFIGLASVTGTCNSGCETDVRFQSLFYWISLCDRCLWDLSRHFLSVSILVLLD